MRFTHNKKPASKLKLLSFPVRLIALSLYLAMPGIASAFDVRSNITGPPIYIKAVELDLGNRQSAWHGRYGAGLALAPKYPGSGEHAVDVDLDLKLFWKNTLFFENGTIGVIALKNRIWRAGVLMRGVPGRRHDKLPTAIQGLGKIGVRLDGGVFVGMSLYKTYLTGEFFTDLSDVTKGQTLNLETGYTVELSRQARLVPYVRLKWGSAQHLQAFFGVNAQQAASTGLARFTTRPSLYESAFGVLFENDLGENWRLGTSANLAILDGSAGKSPITKSQFGSQRQFTLRVKLVKVF